MTKVYVLYLFRWNNNSSTFVIKKYVLVDVEVENRIQVDIYFVVSSIQSRSLKNLSAVVTVSGSWYPRAVHLPLRATAQGGKSGSRPSALCRFILQAVLYRLLLVCLF